jgi:hypothetical protein
VHASALCVTATLLPATVSVADRLAGPLAPALTVIDPEPVPPPAPTDTHVLGFVTVQAQPLPVVTPTLDVPPPLGNEIDDLFSEYVHAAGSASLKLATVAAVLFNARALSSALATPVAYPLYAMPGFEKFMIRVAVPYDITVRKCPPGS